MPIVKFIPAEINLDVPANTLVIDAARSAGIMIDLPCGGKGTCGKCLVQIIAGQVENRSAGQPTAAEKAAGFVQACQSSITQAVTIAIPAADEKPTGWNGDDSIDLLSDHLPQLSDLCPLTQQITLQIPPPGKEDGLSDLDRINRELKSARSIHAANFPLPVIRKLSDLLRRDAGLVTLTLFTTATKTSVLDISSGHAELPHLGIAIDLGTTTISVQLIDLKRGKILYTKNGYNEQIHCGLDIISRINYACQPARLEDLRIKAVHSINRLIAEAAQEAEINKEQIYCAHVSGNTVMLHLLLGLNPEYIRLAPYTPTVLQVPPVSAREAGIAIHPDAVIAFSPGIGSYVGGDITAGILCTDLAQDKEEICLFLDIGTNGEMVIGNNEFLISCACSAGPAFEGGGIECGMRATTGAINSVTIDRETGQAQYTTIGNATPLGICGSGMIDLVAELFLSGWLDAAGKLNRSKKCPFIQLNGRRACYTIADAAAIPGGKPIIITENDIDNLMRAKAAIHAAAAVLLKQIGISFADLAKFYVAGGFGRFLNLQNAIIIGLLPDMPPEKFQYLGNTSLLGSYLLLLSDDFRNRQLTLTKRMTYIDLSNFPGFMDEYTAALFLPHTELHYFPSVMERLKTK